MPRMPAINRDLSVARELILPVFTQWSRVGSVQSILADLENGQFYDAALLWSQMLRDDRVRAVMDVRVNSVLGCPMRFEPAGETARAARVADAAEDDWWGMVPRSELAALYSWGIGLGVGIARREWDGWMPRLRVWHPSALWFSLAEDRYYLRLANGQIPISLDDPNWVLFTPYGYKYARISGLIRSLAMPFLARQWAFRDRARHSERHGIPFLVGTTPPEANQEEKNAYRVALASVGSETVVIAPKGEDGNQWGVELVEAKSNSHEVFGAQIDHLDAAIAIVVLGQSMSTTGQGGLGSQANPGDSVRGDIKKFDAATLSDLGRQILDPWARFNFGQNVTPCPCWEVDPPSDGLKKAQELSALGDAIAKLQQYGLDGRAVLESAGAPLVEMADVEEQPPAPDAEESAAAEDADEADTAETDDAAV